MAYNRRDSLSSALAGALNASGAASDIKAQVRSLIAQRLLLSSSYNEACLTGTPPQPGPPPSHRGAPALNDDASQGPSERDICCAVTLDFLDADGCCLSAPVFAAERPRALAALTALPAALLNLKKARYPAAAPNTSSPRGGTADTSLLCDLLRSAHAASAAAAEAAAHPTQATFTADEVDRRIASALEAERAEGRSPALLLEARLRATEADQAQLRAEARTLREEAEVEHVRARAQRDADAATAAEARGRLAAEREEAAARESVLRRNLDAEAALRRGDATRFAEAEREMLLRLRAAEDGRRSAETAAALSLERWRSEAALELEVRTGKLARDERRVREEQAAFAAEAAAGREAAAKLPGMERRLATAEEEVHTLTSLVGSLRKDAAKAEAACSAATVGCAAAESTLWETGKRLTRAEATRDAAEAALDAARGAAHGAREALLRDMASLAGQLDAARAAIRERDAALTEAAWAADRRAGDLAREASSELSRAASSWGAAEAALLARAEAAEEAERGALERAEEEAAQAAGLRLQVEELTHVLTHLRASRGTARALQVPSAQQAAAQSPAAGRFFAATAASSAAGETFRYDKPAPSAEGGDPRYPFTLQGGEEQMGRQQEEYFEEDAHRASRLQPPPRHPEGRLSQSMTEPFSQQEQQQQQHFRRFASRSMSQVAQQPQHRHLDRSASYSGGNSSSGALSESVGPSSNGACDAAAQGGVELGNVGSSSGTPAAPSLPPQTSVSPGQLRPAAAPAPVEPAAQTEAVLRRAEADAPPAVAELGSISPPAALQRRAEATADDDLTGDADPPPVRQSPVAPSPRHTEPSPIPVRHHLEDYYDDFYVEAGADAPPVGVGAAKSLQRDADDEAALEVEEIGEHGEAYPLQLRTPSPGPHSDDYF